MSRRRCPDAGTGAVGPVETAPRRAHGFPRRGQRGRAYGRLPRRRSGSRAHERLPRGGSGGRNRWIVPAGLLVVLVSHAAPADLVGRSETRALDAGVTERALIEANPILERIARERPEALREILDRLRAPAPSYRRSLEALDDAEDPGGSQSGIFAENPDLADYYRESPEAALDLLRLIREATKER